MYRARNSSRLGRAALQADMTVLFSAFERSFMLILLMKSIEVPVRFDSFFTGEEEKLAGVLCWRCQSFTLVHDLGLLILFFLTGCPVGWGHQRPFACRVTLVARTICTFAIRIDFINSGLLCFMR